MKKKQRWVVKLKVIVMYYKEKNRELVGMFDATYYSSKKAADAAREGINFPDSFEIFKITIVMN